MTKKLTYEQRKVVDHYVGHALVKAVPGSGKTTTLVKRVERLVKSGVSPSSILVLMYNKSAADSFSEKLKIALKTDVIPQVRTFHSLALKIVRFGEHRKLLSRKRLLKPEDHRYTQLVKQAYQDGFEHDSKFVDPSDIEDFELFISRCRADDITPSDASNDPVFKDVNPGYIHSYRRFCEMLDEYSLRTFDDCLIEAVSLLRTDQTIAAHFNFIIVDEYQDVNFIQHSLIRLLSLGDTSVMAVGDINQCIYEWRGARPDFIGGLFQKHFAKTKVFHLSCTFRFGHTLSLAANSVIRRNSAKLSNLCISHPSTPQTKVTITPLMSLSDVLLRTSGNNGTKAILARTKASLAETEIALRILGLPYTHLKSATVIHSRSEVGLLIVGVLITVYGDLRLLDDNTSKRNIIYGFLREAGFRWQRGQLTLAIEKLMKRNADFWVVLEEIFINDDFQKRRLKTFASIVCQANESTPCIEVINILTSTGTLGEVGTGSVTRTGSNDKQRGIQKIIDLINVNMIDARQFLELMLAPAVKSNDPRAFTLSTLHGSKGLEWDNVVLLGLEEQEFPGGKSSSVYPVIEPTPLQNEENMEEERRLFYVAITRAREELSLVVPDDPRLKHWLDNRWDTSPTKTPIATRFVYESGITNCTLVTDFINKKNSSREMFTFSKFHKWYLRELHRVKI